MKLATAYLSCYPSDSYTLCDLGNRLEQFLRANSFSGKSRTGGVPREELALDMVRFEWAQVVAFDGRSKPPISPDDILDTPSSRLRLGLQPHLSLLDPDYTLDNFLIAVKKRESDVLRGEASNAVESAPKAAKRRKRIRPPKHVFRCSFAFHSAFHRVFLHANPALPSSSFRALRAIMCYIDCQYGSL